MILAAKAVESLSLAVHPEQLALAVLSDARNIGEGPVSEANNKPRPYCGSSARLQSRARRAGDFEPFEVQRHGVHIAGARIEQMAGGRIARAGATLDNGFAFAGVERLDDDPGLVKTGSSWFPRRCKPTACLPGSICTKR